ncbi:MAG: DUF2950 domain-containing protein [Candidatus Acidiferrales bacterium]
MPSPASNRSLISPARVIAAGSALLLGLALAPQRSLAQQADQKTYPTAEAAANALFEATNSGDKQQMLVVLGHDAHKIVSSGDDVEDESLRFNFVTKYQEMHRLVNEPDGTTTLYIGAENWPTPIPLVQKNGAWYFDTDAARKEIVYRRIGENEMSAIRICEELAKAQKEYYAKQNNVYAAKFVSDQGTHDGLYWLGANNEYASPIGPLVANAGSAGGTAANLQSGPVPFRGYYFRILDRQGKDAAGGVMDYMDNGKMTKGFAFVAYPAVFKDSGVMTFIVSSDGVVYEKNLGRRTADVAKSMTEFNPDATWQKSDQVGANAAANETATDETGTPKSSAPASAVTHNP